MLGLATHEPHFSLLREEVRFGGKKDRNKRYACVQGKNALHSVYSVLLIYVFIVMKYLQLCVWWGGGGWGGNRLMLPLSVDNFFKCTVYFMNLVMCWVVFVIYRPATPEETTFHLLHLSLFREYLDFEFSFLKVNYMYLFAWLLS